MLLLLSYECEDVHGCTVNCSQEACLDIQERGFWTRFKKNDTPEGSSFSVCISLHIRVVFIVTADWMNQTQNLIFT